MVKKGNIPHNKGKKGYNAKYILGYTLSSRYRWLETNAK